MNRERTPLPIALGSWICLLAAVLLFGGCGFGQPTSASLTGQSATTSAHAPTSSSPAVRAHEDPHEPASERGGTISAAAKHAEDSVADGAASPTPELALSRFANLYMNWKANTVRAHQLQLAGISIGSARLTAQQTAAQVQGDSTIGQDSVSNSGEVVSISRGQAAASGYWVIVSDEKTRGKGEYRNLPAQVHVTYAVVKHLQAGWVVSAWEPQN